MYGTNLRFIHEKHRYFKQNIDAKGDESGFITGLWWLKKSHQFLSIHCTPTFNNTFYFNHSLKNLAQLSLAKHQTHRLQHFLGQKIKNLFQSQPETLLSSYWQNIKHIDFNIF